VVHPTESSYGLAADPRNAAAMNRLFSMKGRTSSKSVLVLVHSMAQAEKTVKLTGKLKMLARKNWPGPLTVVAPAKTELYVAGGSSVKDAAVRVPASLWAREIAKTFGGPITSTSANVSGDSAAYSADAVRKAFRGREIKPDLLLDAGRLPDRPPTTLVRMKGSRIEVLRQGILEVE
jgi:L-threonylcarbamoyladenylate synthase